jgi:hypothetical protein
MSQKHSGQPSASLPVQMLEYETEFLAETVGLTIEQSRLLMSRVPIDRAILKGASAAATAAGVRPAG